MSQILCASRMTIILICSLVLFFGVLLPSEVLESRSKPLVDAPINDNFKQVVFDSDGLSLEGWWMEVERPRATLIFVHGAGHNRISRFFNTLGFYDSLQKAGVSVLTFDQRNHGNSQYTDGYFRLGASEYRDVLAAKRWLDSRFDSNQPIILCGLSMGGASAVYALATGMHADGLLLFDPVLNTRDVLERAGWVGSGLPAVLFRPMAYLAPIFWNVHYGNANALEVAKTLSLPMIIVQNKTDPVTRSLWGEQLADASETATIAFVPEIDPNDPCLAGKGRWSTHASSFHCHPEWTMVQVENLLSQLR